VILDDETNRGANVNELKVVVSSGDPIEFRDCYAYNRMLGSVIHWNGKE
jgi:hypothetical protein